MMCHDRKVAIRTGYVRREADEFIKGREHRALSLASVLFSWARAVGFVLAEQKPVVGEGLLQDRHGG
jgi:hypothetical protein